MARLTSGGAVLAAMVVGASLVVATPASSQVDGDPSGSSTTSTSAPAGSPGTSVVPEVDDHDLVPPEGPSVPSDESIDGPIEADPGPPEEEVVTTTTTAPPLRFAGLPSQRLTTSGGWSWFEGPRAVLTECELLVGSVATGLTADGPSRDGDVDVITLDLASGSPRVDTLAEGFETDDHNSPGILPLPGGKVVALYSGHRTDDLVRRSFRAPGVWHWRSLAPVRSTSGPVTYSNLAFLAGEGADGVLYDVYRAGRDATVLRSTDRGASWQRVGPLIQNGNNRPYLRYADDGHSRIDLGVTSGHPRESGEGSSIYHGSISGGVLRDSAGVLVGTVGDGASPDDLTLVHAGDANHRAWIQDVVQTPTGPVMTYSVRDLSPGVPPRLRNTYWYARWEGGAWSTHQLGYAGTAIYQLEQHYTGGAALEPGEANRVVISTDVDPATGAPLVSAADGWVRHELLEGVTSDGGQTWQFTPITQDSTVDHMRPVVAQSDTGADALTWMSGTYDSWIAYRTGIEAIVTPDAGGGSCAPPAYEPGPNPIAGDFDGDGRLDHLHYVPGGTPDTVFWGDGTRTVVRVDGTYTPILYRRAAQPDRQAIIWSNPNGQSYLWTTQGRTFRSAPYHVPPGTIPVVGDFNGDWRDDVIHHRPGSAPDRLLLSSGSTYTSQWLHVSGRYQPLVGDLDADGREDVFWYAPGAAADSIWWFGPGGVPASTPTSVQGSYRPSVGDRNGDGTADLYWGLEDSSGYLWTFDPAQRGAVTSTFQR